MLRPDVVFFGEQAPMYAKLFKEMDDCEFLVIIGTSGNLINTDMFLNPKIKHSILNNLEESDAINDNLYSKVLYKKASEAVDEIVEDVEKFCIEIEKKLMNKFKIFTFQSDSSKGVIKVVKKALKDNDSLLELKLSKIDIDTYELRTITDATTLKKSSKLTNDEQKYIDLLKANDEKAELLSYKYKDNKRVTLTAIRECNVGFSFVFEKLRKDREVVISAIRKNSEDF